MAMWLFTEAILAGRPIDVFNHGGMRRDFTFIDDLIPALVATADKAPDPEGQKAPHRLYNIGGNHTENLLDMIAILEETLGRKAKMELLPMQPGDVAETGADVSAIQRDIGFDPKIRIDVGIPRFVDWYKSYHGL
jgi:UDP-glucuronate 4-epimerase